MTTGAVVVVSLILSLLLSDLISGLYGLSVKSQQHQFPVAEVRSVVNDKRTEILNRRRVLKNGAATIGASWLTPLVYFNIGPAHAASPTSAAESIRRAASNIPGFGPADIYFPKEWKGTWKVSREVIIPSTTTSSPDKTYLLNYQIRFLPSVEDNFVVADRGFNQVELETALHNQSTNNKSVSDNPFVVVRSCQWSETNPNDLRLILADGTSKEIKVTKRSVGSDDGWSNTSEFQRVTLEDSRGIPQISARRVLTRWRVNTPTSIEGIELIYDVGGASLGDPMGPIALPTTGQPPGPKLLSKSRLLLEREL